MVKKREPIIKKDVPGFDYRTMFSFNRAGHDSDNMQRAKPKYTQILSGEIRNMKGRVRLMKCDDFLKYNGFTAYPDVLSWGTKGVMTNPNRLYSLPFINIDERTILGWEKANALLAAKIEYIPVLLVGKDDAQIDAFLKEHSIETKEIDTNG